MACLWELSARTVFGHSRESHSEREARQSLTCSLSWASAARPPQPQLDLSICRSLRFPRGHRHARSRISTPDNALRRSRARTCRSQQAGKMSYSSAGRHARGSTCGLPLLCARGQERRRVPVDWPQVKSLEFAGPKARAATLSPLTSLSHRRQSTNAKVPPSRNGPRDP